MRKSHDLSEIKSSSTETVSVMIRDIKIEIVPSAPDKMITKIIKVVHYAYCINQEKFLRVFLSNGDVPMDNNLAERSIRPFTLGRKNWVNIFSEQGAEASSVLYSIVETAKANNLRVYDYLEYTLDQLVNHSDDTDRNFLNDLLPCSDYVQEHFCCPKKS